MVLKKWEAVKSGEDQRKREHERERERAQYTFTERDGTFRRGKENRVHPLPQNNKHPK